MLHLDAMHRSHGVGAMHTGIVRVEEQHGRAKHGESRENKCAPSGSQCASCASYFHDSQTEKNESKSFVLQDFEITCHADPPVFRAEGPKFRIAENENENSGEKKTERPRVAKEGPTIAQACFEKDEESGKDDEDSREMMIELAFLFVTKQFCLSRGI